MKLYSNYYLLYTATTMTSVSSVMESSSPISVVDVSLFPTPDNAFIYGHDTVHTIFYNEIGLTVVLCTMVVK